MPASNRHRSSSRPSRTSSVSPNRGDNPFDDENNIESFGVADGFQSSFNLQNMPSTTRETETKSSSNTRGKSSVFRDSQKKQPIAQENTPSLIPRNSFSLRHDAQYSDHPRRLPSVSSTIGPATQADGRPVSLLSRQSTYVRPESTYNGPSAPSHPYGMYPQNSTETANRASVVSTVRPTRERSYHGRDRPTHPYAMYPQNPVSESDTDTLNASTDIASVGFPGLGHQYARRLGADGEEADDIIGPDGHTEQLPPYTRYANIGSVPFKRDSHLGYGHLPTIRADASSTANEATSMSDTLLSSTARLADAGNSNSAAKEKWSKRSKKRTCCGRMPVWGVAVIIVLLIAASATMGGVIGRFLVGHRRQDSTSQGSTDPNSGQQTASSTAPIDPSMPTFGAAPLPAPLPTPPLVPTGTFNLTLNTPAEQCGTCLPDSQQAAWDCMTDSSAMTFIVKNPILTAGNVQLIGPDPNATPLMYGGQYPSLQSNITASFNLDPNNKTAGTALYFNSTYTKQVLLQFHGDDSLTSPAKRSLEAIKISGESQVFSRNLKSRTQIKAGAGVWNCIWPETNIDGFIYVNVDAPAATSSATSSSSSSTASYTAATTTDKATQVPTNLYPKKVKLIEYRVPDSPRATCTLMKYEGGTLVPSDTAPNGIATSFVLQESDPPIQGKFIIAKWRQSELSHVKRDDFQGYCSCELSNTL